MSASTRKVKWHAPALLVAAVGLALLVSVSVATSGCGLCFGSAPSHPLQNDLVAVRVSMDDAGARIDAHSVLLDDVHRSWDVSRQIQSPALAIGAATILLDDRRFRFPEGTSATLPDTVDTCAHSASTGEWICAVAAPGLLPHLGDSLRVAVARSAIVAYVDFDAPGRVLWESQARFVSDDRYRVTSVSLPTTFDGRVVFVRSHQTRQVVADSSGTVVNDIVYASSLDIASFAADGHGLITLELHSTAPVHQLSLSPDRDRLAIEQDGSIAVVDAGGRMVMPWTQGRHPSFGEDGVSLYYLADIQYNGGTLVRKQLATGEVRTLTGGEVLSFALLDSYIVYARSTELRTYDLGSGADTLLITREHYENVRRGDQPLYVSGSFEWVEPLTDGAVMVFAQGSWMYEDEEGC